MCRGNPLPSLNVVAIAGGGRGQRRHFYVTEHEDEEEEVVTHSHTQIPVSRPNSRRRVMRTRNENMDTEHGAAGGVHILLIDIRLTHTHTVDSISSAGSV